MKHMRKIIALVLVVMSVCTIALSASAGTKWVTGGTLKFRSSAEVADNLIDKIASGLPVYEHYTTGSWSRITFDGTLGYVMTAYLTTTDPGYSTPQNVNQAFGFYLLQRGCEGFRVKNLQLALSAEGFYGGSFNGVFGSDTETAVENYQTAEGITSDGLVGDVTKSHLWSDYSTHLTTLGYVE